MAKPKVAIEPDIHEWLSEQAKKNKRTIQAQLEVFLELSKNAIESGISEIQKDEPISLNFGNDQAAELRKIVNQ